MAVINVVVPPMSKSKFSGGLLCILEHAQGLRKRGHEVNVLPIAPSAEPQWFKGDFGRLIHKTPEALQIEERHARRQAAALRLRKLLDANAGVAYKAARSEAESAALWQKKSRFPQAVLAGMHSHFLQKMMVPADVTLATSYETALPVALHGSGTKYYFMQHFEPYFAGESADPEYARREALLSYRLGLKLVANSPWLQHKIKEDIGLEAARCPNAINHTVYRGEVKSGPLGEVVTVISYGGRNARWKGFLEMAQAVKWVRERLPEREIRWQIFGDSLLPPDNAIATYEPLGFLQPPQLAQAYQQADVLLSASWYESFPLFPLEAMACGLPVITTPAGTEDFAIHEQTAELVPPRDGEQIGKGLLRVIQDDEYRLRIAAAGRKKSLEFSWEHAAARMETVLLGADR